ncbi:unnamed protein product [marine sediment metagenome]|uniref:Replication-associated protein ORF2/G2P domain-containing protein n=1 Tax=marine sediment metagenome TaxID=412755 RepID=X1ESL7_9ZZZZ
MDYAKKDIVSMLNCVKKRYGALKRPIRGYFWVLEISENDHVHYHLVVAIDRMNVTKIPDELKFEELWGQRTGVEFIKKSVRGYLSRYLSKSDARIIGMRGYGVSQKLK